MPAAAQILKLPVAPSAAGTGVPRAAAALAFACAILLVAAFGGVQPHWYLPIYAVLFTATLVIVALAALGQVHFPGRALYPALLLVLLVPVAQIVFHSTADRAATLAPPGDHRPLAPPRSRGHPWSDAASGSG